MKRLTLLILLISSLAFTQTCPNIGFENGDLSGWEGEGVEAAAGNAEMVEMTEDDILAALQSLENAGPKDRGDGRDD